MTKKSYVFTTREKVLVIALIIIAAVTGTVMFLIIPARDAHAIAQSDLEMARSLHMRAVQEMAAVPGLQASINNMTELLDIYREKYTVFNHPEDLEFEFTQFLIKNGMVPDSVMLRYMEPDDPVFAGEFQIFEIRITAGSPYIDNLALLADYANSVYSYRLTRMNISPGSGAYTVEAVLR